MVRRRHTPDQVIKQRREAELATVEGSTIAEAARRTGVTQQTFLPVARRVGGLRIDKVTRLKRLESENNRLK